MPKVSIITPLHNKGPYVEETLCSVLAQTMPDWELIVVENGSTDNGPEVVRKLPDPRIQLVVSQGRGPGAARNFGLGLATGEWILFLDADDLLEPDYLSMQLACAKSGSEPGLIVGCTQEFDEGCPDKRWLRRPAGWRNENEELMSFAISCAPWPIHSALIRRSHLPPPLWWCEELDAFPSEDSAFWFPVIVNARIAWSDATGALYRRRTIAGRNETRDISLWIDGLTKIIDHNVAALAVHGGRPTQGQCLSILRMLEEKYWIAYRVGKTQAARKALEKAQYWLAQCSPRSFSVVIRKVVGVHGAIYAGKALRLVLAKVISSSKT